MYHFKVEPPPDEGSTTTTTSTSTSTNTSTTTTTATTTATAAATDATTVTRRWAISHHYRASRRPGSGMSLSFSCSRTWGIWLL